MLSPSKKPKRTHEDKETHHSAECATPAKKQKAQSDAFITSSPCPSLEKDSKSKPAIHSTKIAESTTEQTTTSNLFSPPLKFHQKDTEESQPTTRDHDYFGDSDEQTTTTEHHIQTNDNWVYEISKVVTDEVEEIEEELAEFNPYLFIKNLPAHQPALRTLLPPRLSTDPKFCLVLDLDETLVHCSTETLLTADLVFPVVFNNVEYTVFARKRPFIEEFLSQMATLFEIVVFTASQEVYADRLLDILDPERKYIRHRFFRDSCVCVDGNYLKDLTILGRDLSKVIIVDNSPQAFGYQIDNGIPIESWFDDEADQELMRLVPFLESVINEPDVRPIIREKFKLYELISKF